AFGLFGGLRAGNPGVDNALAVYLIAPLLFWILVWAVGVEVAGAVLTWLAAMTSVLATTIVLYVAQQKGLLPPLLPDWVLVGSGSGYNDLGSHTAVRVYGLSTLVAAGPLWVASLFVPRDELLPPVALR